MESVKRNILKDPQIRKFSLYGFLKDLRFFEPYLLIYLIGLGYDLFTIGVLIAIREAIVYVFEVPSGVIADHYGKKRELMLCFLFYIVSFVFFFIGSNLYMIGLGMVFFGLGEAFRSGSHKAMILSYLEQKGWFDHKTFVYGRTRSFSMLGGALSSFLSIILILNLPSTRWIFLISIVPYLLDFALIASYPDSLDERSDRVFKFKSLIAETYEHIVRIIKDPNLTKILISSSMYDAIFKSIRDYIQPILKMMLMTSTTLCFFKQAAVSQEDQLTILLGVLYGVFYIFSAWVSKNAYLLNRWMPSSRLMSLSFDLMAVMILALGLLVMKQYVLGIVLIFFLLNAMKDARRPVFVDVCGDVMKKDQRATVLSVDSQFKALFVIVLAPLFGWIADHYSIGILFVGISVFIIVINRMLKIHQPKAHK